MAFYLAVRCYKSDVHQNSFVCYTHIFSSSLTVTYNLISRHNYHFCFIIYIINIIYLYFACKVTLNHFSYIVSLKSIGGIISNLGIKNNNCKFNNL